MPGQISASPSTGARRSMALAAGVSVFALIGFALTTNAAYAHTYLLDQDQAAPPAAPADAQPPDA
ncbi:MAG: hypothetical protein ACXU8U_13370, partial [Asticcacaulis sp.]